MDPALIWIEARDIAPGSTLIGESLGRFPARNGETRSRSSF